MGSGAERRGFDLGVRVETALSCSGILRDRAEPLDALLVNLFPLSPLDLDFEDEGGENLDVPHEVGGAGPREGVLLL